MESIVREKYNESDKNERTAFISRSDCNSSSLDDFQLVYKEAKEMERQGLIEVDNEHYESSSGGQLIDIFQIKRLH